MNEHAVGRKTGQESRQHYLDWWAGRGLVISMWEHLPKTARRMRQCLRPRRPATWTSTGSTRNGAPPISTTSCPAARSRPTSCRWPTPISARARWPRSSALSWRAARTPSGSTRAPSDSDAIVLDENNRWWRSHLDLIRACKRHAQGRYFVGCPDLIEGLDTLAGLRGTQPVLLDMMDRPGELEQQLQAVNDIWFEVFDRIYDEINEDGEMAFCYFSLWGPGRVAKLQSDISVMISTRNFRRFVQPFIREQCQRLDYSLYHLDGVGAIRHLDALLEIEELNAIQWTPGVGQPQGGDPCWYDLYKRIRAGGKAIMPCWVELDELQPLLDAVGPAGVNVLMHFQSERDIEPRWKSRRITGDIGSALDSDTVLRARS